MTSRSLCAYLEGTGLPLGGGLVRALRMAGVILSFCSGAGVLLVLARAETAGDLWRALPMLVGLPGFVLAWWCTSDDSLGQPIAMRALSRSRVGSGALALFTGLVGLALSASVVRGPGDVSWVLQPLLALVAALVVGVVPGLLLTLTIAITALVATGVQEPGAMRSALVLAGVALTGGLVGAFLHRLLLSVLDTLEDHRLRFRDQRKALRHREKLLNHALRVGAVGDLAGMAVHQLRNQFQVMMGHLALARSADPDQQGERLDQVAATMAQARPLLDQLMNLSHPEQGDAKEHDLGVQLDAFIVQLRRMLPTAVQLDVRRGRGGAFPVFLVAQGLEHSLWNLVINARQAMGGNGLLQLSVDGDERWAWIAVSDSGPGMSEATLAQIFEPYFTTKPKGYGTGLGLTAVARYVRSQGGEVLVRSQEGVGTRFELRFPRAQVAQRLRNRPRLKARSARQAVG